jgi:hypothetical protein
MLEATPYDRWFFSALALTLVALVAAGFAPSFYARDWFLPAAPLPPLVQAHGIIGTAWVLLYALQALLIARGRVQWHRRAGVLGAALTIVFVATGAFLIAAFERTHGAEPRNVLYAHLFTNGAPLSAFGLLAAAGIWQRRVAARHKRLMLLAAVVLLPPAIGRLFAQLGIAHLNLPVYAGFAFACAGFDWLTRGRPQAISLLGGATLVTIDVTATAWLAAVGS